MIQDIAPHIYHNEYHPSAPAEDSYLLCYQEGKILLRQKEPEGEISFPRFRELKEKEEHAGELIYLFTIDEDRFYLLGSAEENDFPGCFFQEIRSLRLVHPQYLAFAGITGYQLFRWYESRRYCGCCGAPMAHSKTERQMYCPACGHYEYPVLSPAVIVRITNGDRLVMSKYEGRAFTNYALIAGYAEIGETIEDTVRREVMEEVGLRVKNIRYYKSQPWSFSGTLLFGFFCDVDGDDTLTVDHSELAMAEWFHRSEIRGQGNSSSLTNEMMLVFAEGKEPR